jgi:hypothetical protein
MTPVISTLKLNIRAEAMYMCTTLKPYCGTGNVKAMKTGTFIHCHKIDTIKVQDFCLIFLFSVTF